MYDYIKNNKTTNIYWLKGELKDIQFSISIKPQESIILLPKFEDYSNVAERETLRDVDGGTAQEFIFKWQEKVFSQYDFEHFKNIDNCVSERDLNFHEILKNQNKTPQKVFTYINEEYILPLPVVDIKSNEKGILNLSSCFHKLNLGDKFESFYGHKTDSMRNLYKGEERISSDEDQWESMHIFYDNSKYDEEFNLIYKDECLLLSVYHHSGYNYLMVSPDVNNESNSYNIESSSGVLDLEYFVDIDYGVMGCGEELVDLLNKLYKKWEKKQKQLISFVMPPLGKIKYYISLEITSAQGFEMDNIYIEFHIKVPEDIDCKSDLKGRTHITESLVTEDTQVWSFGHIVDIELDVATGIDPPPLKIFFEAISLDRWGRQRTEGYCYLPLPLQPGCETEQLSCSRPEELNEIDAESRRFFIGGCHLIEDLEVLEKPQLYTTNFRYVPTGSIAVHWTVISQSHSPGRQSPVPEASGSALLQGADAVLKQYKRAKATLEAATRSFRGSGDSESS